MADNTNETQILLAFHIKDTDTREILLDFYLLTKYNLCDENKSIKKLVIELFKVQHNVIISTNKLRVAWPYNVNTLQEFRNLPSKQQEIYVYVSSRDKEDEIKQKLKTSAPPKTDSNIGSLPTTDLDIETLLTTNSDGELDQRQKEEIEAMKVEADMEFQAMEHKNKIDYIDTIKLITNLEKELHEVRSKLTIEKSNLTKANDRIRENSYIAIANKNSFVTADNRLRNVVLPK